MMKYLCTILLFAAFFTASAQDQMPAQLRETARSFLMKGDLDNAIKTLETAKQQAPADIEVLKDLAYATYLKKDFARSMEVGKEAVANPSADDQAYQILGLTYKAIAMYKDADKLYRTALVKFPSNGILHNEYGELMALDGRTDEAIAMWEKGIRADPSYNNNYFNAAMYYIRAKNWLRVVLYGEIFVNLESFTTRTEGIKAELYNAYKNLFTANNIRTQSNARTTSDFEKAIYAILDRFAARADASPNVETLTDIRSAFVTEWMKENDKTYPYQLFKQQQYFLTQGYFPAYNQWLFGDAVNPDAYKLWQELHAKEVTAFKTYQQSRVFKIPAGQYYFAR